ncbi:hypothetical protein MMC19_003558 [Ptychographa xylographoides]|nr:hypothetical protein [Ptychographa xylographoides]
MPTDVLEYVDKEVHFRDTFRDDSDQDYNVMKIAGPPPSALGQGNMWLDRQGSLDRPDPLVEANETYETPAIIASHPDSSLALSRQQATFSLSLSEHVALIPPLSIYQLSPAARLAATTTISQSEGSGHNPSNSHQIRTPRFSIDETFQLTQILIDLYPRFISTIVRRSIHPEPHLPSKSSPFHGKILAEPEGIPLFGNTTPDSSLHPSTGRDDAAILLLLSCHHRLIDMWELIFCHISEIPTHRFGALCLKFKVGSFVPSASTTAVPMEIIMVVELTKELLKCVRELVSELSESRTSVAHDHRNGLLGPNSEDGSTELASRALLRRATRMVEQISDIKDMISERRRELAKMSTHLV